MEESISKLYAGEGNFYPEYVKSSYNSIIKLNDATKTAQF